MNALWWAVPLVAVVFLWTLNEFLRGRLKDVISGVLALMTFGLVGLAFFVSGWKWGLAALMGAFALGNLFRAPALALARRFIPYPDLGVERYQQRSLQQTMRDFGSEDYFRRRDAEEESERSHRNNIVESAARNEQVREVLERHGSSERDLAALYERVEVQTIPPAMREEALRNAELVDFFLTNSTPGEYQGEYTRNVTDQGTSMTLSLWCSSNPSGKRPE